MPDDQSALNQPVTVDTDIALQHDGKDIERILSAMSPIIERVVAERLQMQQNPGLMKNYSKAHAEGSWDRTG
jgi:hypothetical protein